MKFRIHLTNPAIFAMLWVALSALVLHDIVLRRAAGACGAGEAVSDKVVTKEFVLVDENGKTRARIGMNAQTDAPSVQLFDSAGQQRAQLRLNKNEVPSLRLYDSGGSLKSVMGFTLNDMQPSYVTFDGAGVGHVENASRPDAAFVRVHDEDLMGKYGFNSGVYSVPTTNTWYMSDYAQIQAAQAAQAQAETALQQAEELRAQVEALRAQNGTPRDPFSMNLCKTGQATK